MPLQYFYWILMVLWLVFGYVTRDTAQPFTYRQWGGGILQFLLFCILGYALFGSAVKTAVK